MKDVLLADARPIVLLGFAQAVEQVPGYRVGAEVQDGKALLREVRRGDYATVLLDLELPGGGGLELLKRVQDLRDDLPVVMTSMRAENGFVVRALRSGAAGFLGRRAGTETLAAALNQVTDGQIYVPPELDHVHIDDLDGASARMEGDPAAQLSNRELQVFLHLAEGMPIKAIAEELSLSSSSVATYRRRVLDKLGLHNTPELIRFAIRHSYVD